MKSRRTVLGCETEVLQLMEFAGFLEIEDDHIIRASIASAFHMGEVENAQNIPINVTNVLKGLETGFKKKFIETSCDLQFGE